MNIIARCFCIFPSLTFQHMAEYGRNGIVTIIICHVLISTYLTMNSLIEKFLCTLSIVQLLLVLFHVTNSKLKLSLV